MPQGHYWIDPCRTTAGHIGRQHGHKAKHQRGRDERRRVERGDAEQQTLKIATARNGSAEPENESGADENRTLTQHQARSRLHAWHRARCESRTLACVR